MMVILTIVLLIIACLLFGLIWRFKLKALEEYIHVRYLIWFVFGLIFLSEIIYGAFFYQIGPPPGENLNQADWLSFLGNYLGFSGSLIMAFLVYKQDRKINQLLLLDYQPAFRGEVLSYNQETEESYTTIAKEVYLQLNNLLYVKHDMKLSSKNKSSSVDNDVVFLVYITIENLSKLTANDVHINSIKIFDGKQNNEGSIYSYKCEYAQINGTYRIFSKQKLRLCVAMHSFPQELDLSFFQLSFSIAGFSED